MPPDPPRVYRLWWAFIRIPLHEILDPPHEIPLENDGNGTCKTLDFKIFLGVGVPTIFYQPFTSSLQNLLRIDKESQFLAMSNIKFILLPGVPPLDPQQGSALVPRWGRQPHYPAGGVSRSQTPRLCGGLRPP